MTTLILAARWWLAARRARAAAWRDVRAMLPDEAWARETTAEFRAIRADLVATATEEHRRMRRQRRLDGLAALKRELVLLHKLRQAGWREHLTGRLP